MKRLSAEESLLEMRRVGAGAGLLFSTQVPAVAQQWQAIAHPQEVPASAHVDRRAEAIRKAGIKVFTPKTT